MNEEITTKAEQSETINISASSAPYQTSDSAKKEPITSSLVIPVVLGIVLAVVIVATFFEDEYSSMLTTLGLSNDEEAVAEIMAPEESTADTGTLSTAIPAIEQAQPDAAIASNLTQDSNQSTDSTTSPASTDSDASNENNESTLETPVTASVEQSPELSESHSQPSTYTPENKPDYASQDFGTPYQAYDNPDSEKQRELIAVQRNIRQEIEDQRRRYWEEMMEYRRQAWLEAEEARRAQHEELQNIRTAVLKRIQNDREDMERQIQERNREMDKRRDQAGKRRMDFRRHLNRTEI